MSLVNNSRDLSVDTRGRLSGSTKWGDNSWTSDSIDLNPQLGNQNGKFDIKGHNFAGSARNMRVVGTILHAELNDSARRPVEANFDLSKILKVVDGKFVFLSDRERDLASSIENGGRELQDAIQALTTNSRDLRIIQDHYLTGKTRKEDGTWTTDKIDLNVKLGNKDGRFDIKGSNFAASARENETKVEGTTLRAHLLNSRRVYDLDFLELASVIKVVDGSFMFISDYDGNASASAFTRVTRNLRIDGGVLSGETKQGNGSWTSDSIDLNSKIGNRNGRFSFDGSNFSAGAQYIRLDGTKIRAELLTERRGVEKDSFDLTAILEVLNGKFAFKADFERQREERIKARESMPGLAGDSRNLWISGLGLLHGDTKKKNGSWTSDKINLSAHLGNQRGHFNLDGNRFTVSASDLRLQDTRLIAKLDNGSSWPSEAFIELSLVLKVDDGQFVFISKHQRQRIIASVFCMSLDSENGGMQLHGLCLNKFGKLQGSSIDLNSYYWNNGGSFASGESGSPRNLHTAENASLEVTSANVLLKATLRVGGGRKDASVDLNTNIQNDDGHFKFVKHDGFFDRDGPGTKFVEKIPIVGYVAALVHYAAGNSEWAKRAAATATNSIIVAIGVTIGSFFGGPLGAALGAGITTSIGIAAETEIKKTINDEGLQAEFEEATVGRYIYDTIFSMLATGAGKQVGMWMKKIPTSEIAKTSKALESGFKWVNKKAGSKATKTVLDKLGDAFIKEQLPQDWFETEKKVNNM